MGDWARGDVAKVRHLDGQIVKGTITDIDYCASLVRAALGPARTDASALLFGLPPLPSASATDYAFLVLEGETITRAWPISKLMPDDSGAAFYGLFRRNCIFFFFPFR